MGRIVLVGLLTGVALSLVGCGYALVGKASNIPEHVETVYLRPLENETRRAQVEQIVTRAVNDELVTRKQFRLVDSESAADAVLSGAITSFVVRPVNFDEDGAAIEYEINIEARMEFLDLTTEEVIWGNDRYSYRDNYVVERNADAFFDRERLAIERTAFEFARTMVIDLLEGF